MFLNYRRNISESSRYRVEKYREELRLVALVVVWQQLRLAQLQKLEDWLVATEIVEECTEKLPTEIDSLFVQALHRLHLARSKERQVHVDYRN